MGEKEVRGLLGKYLRPVYGLAFHLLYDPDAAYEYSVEAFTAALSADYRGEDDFRLKVYSALVACCRKARIMPRQDDTLDRMAGERRAQLAVINNALQRLDLESRLFLLMRDQARLPYGTIASVMGVREGEAKAQTFQARGQLRDKITEIIEHG